MRKGFVYIRLQIYIVLLALIVGGAWTFGFTVLHRNFQWIRQSKENVLIQHALDTLCEDLQYAEKVTLTPESALVVKSATDYTYFLNNRRLVRRKDGYLYLTPANLPLDSLVFAEENGLYRIVLTAGKNNYERLVRR